MLRYVSGNKMCHALKYGKFLLGNNKQPIINYISENANEDNKLKVYNEYSNLLENIETNLIPRPLRPAVTRSSSYMSSTYSPILIKLSIYA